MDNKTHLDYVCPRCFNNIGECTCNLKPSYLMEIDRNIQKHIRLLNNKGYSTRYSCESHNQNENMYVAFMIDYGFDGGGLWLPDGFKYDKKHNSVSFLYDRKTTDEDFETQKKEHLKTLYEWCMSLPIRKREHNRYE